MKTVNPPIFKQISPNEIKFMYKDQKFILEEGRIGVYGIGYAIRLYSLNGLDKKMVKCIGWTKSDNHGTSSSGCYFQKIVTIEECKTGAIKYLTNLLD